MMGRLARRLLTAHAIVVFLFLYLPIAVLIAYSFNTSRLNVVWEGFTTGWYLEMARDAQILRAARNSLIAAGLTTLIATPLGTLTAFALARHRFRGKQLLEGLIYIPIILPEIVMGISLLALFSLVGIRLGLATVVVSHVTFCASFVTVVVRARLHGMDPMLERAAMDLGANPWRTFWKVTLPLVSPGILAGALIAFTLSLDDVIIAFFTSGPGSTTLPLYVLSMVRLGVSPKVNALSASMLAVTLLCMGLALGLRQWRLHGRRRGTGGETDRDPEREHHGRWGGGSGDPIGLGGLD